MKIYFYIIIYAIVFCYSKRVFAHIETLSVDNMANLITNSNPLVIQKDSTYLYVSAKSGLNYRKSPKGKVLGKFPLNTRLKVIKHTKVFDEIIDEGKSINGEWLGIEIDINKEKNTVYVFSAFLTIEPTRVELKLYYASPYFKEWNNTTRSGFVNLSDSYFENLKTESTLISEADMTNDTILLSQNKKALLLKNLNISKNDTVFIFNLLEDKIYKYKVADLSAIAAINIYQSGGENYTFYDYEFGLKLGKKYSAKGDNFVYIGQDNPFQTGKVKAIVWQEVTPIEFPLKFDSELIDEQTRYWLKNFKAGETYFYSNKNLDYYYQRLMLNSIESSRYLVIIDKNTNKVVFNGGFTGSEGSSYTPIYTTQQKPDWGVQITGEVFKNRPAILYGFMSISFGCPSIMFIGGTEPSIYILCDNRH